MRARAFFSTVRRLPRRLCAGSAGRSCCRSGYFPILHVVGRPAIQACRDRSLEAACQPSERWRGSRIPLSRRRTRPLLRLLASVYRVISKYLADSRVSGIPATVTAESRWSLPALRLPAESTSLALRLALLLATSRSVASPRRGPAFVLAEFSSAFAIAVREAFRTMLVVSDRYAAVGPRGLASRSRCCEIAEHVGGASGSQAATKRAVGRSGVGFGGGAAGGCASSAWRGPHGVGGARRSSPRQ